MNLKLELTKEEAQLLLQFMDMGVKQLGLKSVNAAFVLQKKINEAQAESQKTDEAKS